MYQTYEDEAPLPLIANYTVVKADDEEKRETEDRVILEIGRQDDKPREEHTFSHKKYDKTISHHRSYVLEDYEPRRISYFRPHELDHSAHEGRKISHFCLGKKADDEKPRWLICLKYSYGAKFLRRY